MFQLKKSTADLLVDRRHLRGKMLFWKCLFFLALFLVLVFMVLRHNTASANYIVRFPIQNIIIDDAAQQSAIKHFAEDPHVKAVILSIDSPGGTTTGAEALYESIRELAAKKPVVATLGTMAASGGYAVALSADHIVSRGNTLTGSIGVILQWQDVSGLLQKIGVTTNTLTAGIYKGQPSLFQPLDNKSKETLQAALDSSYQWFVGLVQERRHFSKARADSVANGRIYTGWQAKENGLIDEIGGEEKALVWLQKEKKISANLPIREWRRKEDGWHLFNSELQKSASQFLSKLGVMTLVSQAH